MRQILKNVKEKLVSKYQKNTNSKKTKRFKSRIKARIRKNRQSISKNIDGFFDWVKGAELIELKECNTNEDDRTYDDYDADSDGLCQLAAFLMWSAPLIAAVTGYVFACLLRLLSVATFEALHHDNEVSFAIYSLLSRFDFLLC